MNEIKPVVTEKKEFRDISILIAAFGIFGPSGF